MNTSLPIGWFRSDGTIRKLTALALAVGISCLPAASALADGHGGGHGHAGGGHMASDGHSGGGRRIGGGGRTSGHGQVVASVGRSRSGHIGAAAHKGGVSHAPGLHQSASFSSNTGRNFSRHDQSNSAVGYRAITQERRRNRSVVSERSSRTHSVMESRTVAHGNRVHPRLASRVALANRTSTFDRSIMRPRAQVLLNQRLNQISGRQWTGRGQVCSNHFDPGHGCWFQHGGYWWRCNFWGAHSYCNRLIALGFAPGLCWGWYDDICWGNIVVGMPTDLVDYYYPDPVYTAYTTYDGDEATVYYYAMGDGQYKRVTVIDGNVVDVQIVDEIA